MNQRSPVPIPETRHGSNHGVQDLGSRRWCIGMSPDGDAISGHGSAGDMPETLTPENQGILRFQSGGARPLMSRTVAGRHR